MSLSTSQLFIRRAEVIVGKKVAGSAPVEPTEGRLFQGRVTFNVEKTSESNFNKAKITLYNLSQESRNFLEEKDLIVFLKCGYDDAISTAFYGNVIRGETQRSGADVSTTLECGDGELALQESTIELGLNPGATNRQVIEAAAAALQITAGFKAEIPVKTFPNGFAYAGTAKKLLDEQLKRVGLEWSIQDGELLILGRDQTDGQEAVLVTPKTGLIGFPTKTREGIDFKCLLNTAIRPGRAVKIESKQFYGVLGGKQDTPAALSLVASGAVTRVRRVVLNGDSDEGPWQCEVQTVIPGAGLF